MSNEYLNHYNLPYPLLFLLLLIFGSCQSETTTLETSEGPIVISTDELLEIMGETYLFGYPLILMDLTKQVTTNIERPHPTRPLAPVNQLGHFRNFPDHTLTAVVKPNVDTYYSTAWLDLKEEPQVLSMPATDRYYLLPMIDAYSNVFASPGTRTTGTDAQKLLIAGPNWKGEVPEGLQFIQAPTNMVWLLGRIQVNNPEDGATTVRAIQDGMRLLPLSAYGDQDYSPPKGIVNSDQQNIVPVKAVRDLDVKTYFNRMAEMMVDNPPPAVDSAIVRKMAKIGLVPGQPFDMSTDNLILKTKLKALPKFIHKKMEMRRAEPSQGDLTDGWSLVSDDIGAGYGTDYARRAFVDFVGLGVCIPQDAIYPNCVLDVQGDPLDGRNKYQIHFSADQIPPVNAFWSLTAYNADEFLVENDLNRFARGDRDALIYNEDGSLDLYIQSTPPEQSKTENWLPIPKEGPFYLTLRLYWPKEEVLSGEWKIPGVVPIQ